MPEDEQPPDIVLASYDEMLRRRLVDIIKSPYRESSDVEDWTFECLARVPHPNSCGVPKEVPLRVVLPEGYPFVPVEVFSECEEVEGLPHQEAESGKLCLRDDRFAERDTSRLATYMQWTKEWLADAARGALLKPGDPYELPDFRHDSRKSSPPIVMPLLFAEGSSTYERWKPYVGQTGRVSLAAGGKMRGLFATKFESQQGEVIRCPGWSSSALSNGSRLRGRWILVPDIRYARHRPPRTYAELTELCLRYGIDFDRALRAAWEEDNRAPAAGVILIGFPIPKLTGDAPQEVHWQPFVFTNKRGYRKSGQNNKKKTGWLAMRSSDGPFAPDKRLPWGDSENCSQERLFSRGALPERVRSSRIALWGCGALGSSAADLLVRGGVTNMALYDPDVLEIGNLCRHTLNGGYLARNKALALAMQLEAVNPLASIMGYPARAPLLTAHTEAQEALETADLLLDCTADEVAFEWLSEQALRRGKMMCSMFLNSSGYLLTIVSSGRQVPCHSAFRQAMTVVQEDRAPISFEEYRDDPADAELVRDIGCWHPTFPAQGLHIGIMCAVALDVLCGTVQLEQDKGSVTVLRRRDPPSPTTVSASPMVEVAWQELFA